MTDIPMKTPAAFKALPPLTPAVFHILLALVETERHGYGIMREVETSTGGVLVLGPGTLYGTLKRLLSAGFVEEAEERADVEAGMERRRYYRLTPAGRHAAVEEARRLECLVNSARAARLLSPSPEVRA